jgi:diguanylate cyclase (GGDEF)-like protein
MRDSRQGPLSSHDRLAALLSLTERLSAEQSLERALRMITDAAVEVLPADHASIRVLDPSRTVLLASARSGAGTENPSVALRRGEGISGWVLEYACAARVEDVHSDARFVPQSRQGFAIGSVLAAPLLSGGHAVGVLSLSSATPAAFSADDELFARLLANCSAPLIERARLERLAMTDDLTLAFNARYFLPRLREEIGGAAAMGPSLLLMDLDFFKSVNDTHGHPAGDRVLREFADLVRATTRRVDVLVRRGGDEFALLMPSTSLEQARSIASRIQATIESSPVDVGSAKVKQTVSIGVATWDGSETVEAFERRADTALYEAKRAGRNCVVAA